MPAPTSTTSPRVRAYAARAVGDAARSVPAARNASRAATIAGVSPAVRERVRRSGRRTPAGRCRSCARAGSAAAAPRRAVSSRRGTPGSAGSGTTSADHRHPHALVSVHGRNRLRRDRQGPEGAAARPPRRRAAAGDVVELAAEIGHALPATDPDGARAAGSSTAADSGSLERYLETFAHTVAVMQTAAALHRVAARVRAGPGRRRRGLRRGAVRARAAPGAAG